MHNEAWLGVVPTQGGLKPGWFQWLLGANEQL